jgi:hypothetical protein
MLQRSPPLALCGCDTQGLAAAGTSQVVDQVLFCLGRRGLTT